MAKESSFEKAREQTGSEVQDMLGRLQKRVLTGKLNQNATENAVGLVTKAISVAKSIFEKNADSNIKNTSGENLAKFTNAWHAWGDKFGGGNFFRGREHDTLRKELAPMLESGDLAAKYARQIWRTEMVSYFTAKLQKSDRGDKADVMLALMAGQVVKKTEDEPREALDGAASLDSRLRNKARREALAQRMEDAEGKGKIKDVRELSRSEPGIKEIKVVVGGSLFTVPEELAEKFELKNLIWEPGENRFYAQMSNGCRGNLVIIEVQKPGGKSATAVEEEKGGDGTAAVLETWRRERKEKDAAKLAAEKLKASTLDSDIRKIETILDHIDNLLVAPAQAASELADELDGYKLLGATTPEYSRKITESETAVGELTRKIENALTHMGRDVFPEIEKLKEKYAGEFSGESSPLYRMFRDRVEARFTRLKSLHRTSERHLARARSSIAEMKEKKDKAGE